MIVQRNISFRKLWEWSSRHLAWLLFGATAITLLYKFKLIDFYIPWLPVSLIGTAVAFYVGFKNNSAYDRMWESRKIWGAIVNNSRAWGSYVNNFVSDQFANGNITQEDLHKFKKQLIYRHIGWIYTLRSQLLQVAPWEHAAQRGRTGRNAKKYQQNFAIAHIDETITSTALKQYLPENEYEELIKYKNSATQIIDYQGRNLAQLRRLNVVDDFRHMELQKILYSFYENQGAAERIKKFPLPRQYASMSQYFIGIFLLLMPFSLIPELIKAGNWGIWLSIPITALIGYVYVMMELVGDYTENPFQGMANDIPMLSLSRIIEIDLLEMLGENDLPEPISSQNGVLL
jgi:ion channel-forming bestrophin family protein